MMFHYCLNMAQTSLDFLWLCKLQLILLFRNEKRGRRHWTATDRTYLKSSIIHRIDCAEYRMQCGWVCGWVLGMGREINKVISFVLSPMVVKTNRPLLSPQKVNYSVLFALSNQYYSSFCTGTHNVECFIIPSLYFHPS